MLILWETFKGLSQLVNLLFIWFLRFLLGSGFFFPWSSAFACFRGSSISGTFRSWDRGFGPFSLGTSGWVWHSWYHFLWSSRGLLQSYWHNRQVDLPRFLWLLPRVVLLSFYAWNMGVSSSVGSSEDPAEAEAFSFLRFSTLFRSGGLAGGIRDWPPSFGGWFSIGKSPFLAKNSLSFKIIQICQY